MASIGENLRDRCCVSGYTDPNTMPPFVRVLATTLLTFALTPVLPAQQLGIGMKLGPLASKTRSETIRTTLLPGGTAGIYIPWGLGPRMELQPEVLISYMGSGYIEPDDDRFTTRTMYLQFPVNFKIFLSNAFSLQAGAQAAKLLSAQRSMNDTRTDVTDRYNNMEFSFLGGLGVDLMSGVDLTLRYQNGMTPVLANDRALFPRNQVLSFTMGYRMAQLQTKRVTRRRR
jgi:hypothetical protein